MSAATLLDRLDRVRETGPGLWIAICPAHDDKTPSLSIRETADATLLIHCFAGCDVSKVLGAVDLGLKDLFPANDQHYRAPSRQRIPPIDALRALVGEGFVLRIAAQSLKQGLLSEEDQARLELAYNRICTALEVVT